MQNEFKKSDKEMIPSLGYEVLRFLFLIKVTMKLNYKQFRY